MTQSKKVSRKRKFLLLFSSNSCEYKWMYYKCDHKCLYKVIANNIHDSRTGSNPFMQENHTL